MDVLVEWEDGERNVVSTNELECISSDRQYTKGRKVRMLYGNKYYYGKIIASDKDISGDSESDDDVTLIQLAKKIKEDTSQIEELSANATEDKTESEKATKRAESTADEDELPLSVVLNSNKNNEDIINFEPDPQDEGKIALSKITLINNNEGEEENQINEEEEITESNSYEHDSVFEDSDDQYADPTYQPPSCEARNCKDEIFAACTVCEALLCYEHFLNTGPCGNKHIVKKGKVRLEQNEEDKTNSKKSVKVKHTEKNIVPDKNIVSETLKQPEDYVVEGSNREEPLTKEKRINKKRIAHENKLKGLEYTSPKTGKLVAARTLKNRCESTACKRMGRQCNSFTEEEREKLLDAFNNLQDLRLKREYVVRHVKQKEAKQKTTKTDSRRKQSIYYYLSKDGEMIQVCKTMFLSTLAITDKFVRTALEKKEETGVVTKDNRGGRVPKLKTADDIKRQAILQHISRFPRMESHYCRKDSSRDYLHPDLNRNKMFEMFNTEYKERGIQSSYNTYKAVMDTQNLSIFHPKKDQCSLCRSYRSGNPEERQELQTQFDQHVSEKTGVREKKKALKEDSDHKKVCASFDLQQVIYLPKCNDSKLFYCRRLSNYNFTIHNIKTKECYCFTWHEGIAKRGSCEIATCLHTYLNILDHDGVEEVTLFADGCPGQNKNSIIPTMLLCSLASFTNIKRIALLFFEPYHGQNEGDSAHSCISHTIESSGELFVPSQLVPIFRLAIKVNPYKVIQLLTNEILDFKEVSKTLRVLQIREDNTGNKVDWTKMRELMVTKGEEEKICFKTSHLQEDYHHISLKRSSKKSGTPSTRKESMISGIKVKKLYTKPPPLSQAKYDDLMTLCRGPTATIKHPEHVLFYESPPH